MGYGLSPEKNSIGKGDGEALQDAASGGKKVHERMQLSVFCSK